MTTRWLPLLTSMARDLSARLTLEQALTLIVERAAGVLETERASVRLLDPSRTKLVAKCRHGAPVHETPQEFRLGEGLLGWIAERASPIRSGDADSDPRFVTRPDLAGRVGSFLGVPILSGTTAMGVLSAIHERADYFTEEHEHVLTLLAAIAAPYVEIARLSRLSLVDPLTGVLNRRGADSMFPQVAGRDEDSELIMPLSVAVVDIDLFKRINDEHGHAVGDEVLKHTANVLAGVVRQGDAVIRHGGEEFLLVLPGVGIETAAHIAERARSAMHSGKIDAGTARVSVTISVGIAERRVGESRDDLVARADSAMYEAKRTGRNRVERAD